MSSLETQENKRASSYIILGLGRLGQTLFRALEKTNQVVGTWNRSPSPIPQAHTGPLDTFPRDLLHKADTVLLTVSDQAISPLAQQLIPHMTHAQTILHCSGMLPSTCMEITTNPAVSMGSMHPLQPISHQVAHPSQPFQDIHVGIEGTEYAITQATTLATQLGGLPFSLQGVNRALYHASAVFASNYLVTLAHISQSLASQAGLQIAPLPLLMPLMKQALHNIETQGLPHALTGPLARADQPTIQAHLAQLPQSAKTLYTELAKATLPIASNQRTQSNKTVDDLLPIRALLDEQP